MKIKYFYCLLLLIISISYPHNAFTTPVDDLYSITNTLATSKSYFHVSNDILYTLKTNFTARLTTIHTNNNEDALKILHTLYNTTLTTANKIESKKEALHFGLHIEDILKPFAQSHPFIMQSFIENIITNDCYFDSKHSSITFHFRNFIIYETNVYSQNTYNVLFINTIHLLDLIARQYYSTSNNYIFKKARNIVPIKYLASHIPIGLASNSFNNLVKRHPIYKDNTDFIIKTHPEAWRAKMELLELKTKESNKKIRQQEIRNSGLCEGMYDFVWHQGWNELKSSKQLHAALATNINTRYKNTPVDSLHDKLHLYIQSGFDLCDTSAFKNMLSDINILWPLEYSICENHPTLYWNAAYYYATNTIYHNDKYCEYIRQIIFKSDSRRNVDFLNNTNVINQKIELHRYFSHKADMAKNKEKEDMWRIYSLLQESVECVFWVHNKYIAIPHMRELLEHPDNTLSSYILLLRNLSNNPRKDAIPLYKEYDDVVIDLENKKYDDWNFIDRLENRITHKRHLDYFIEDCEKNEKHLEFLAQYGNDEKRAYTAYTNEVAQMKAKLNSLPLKSKDDFDTFIRTLEKAHDISMKYSNFDYLDCTERIFDEASPSLYDVYMSFINEGTDSKIEDIDLYIVKMCAAAVAKNLTPEQLGDVMPYLTYKYSHITGLKAMLGIDNENVIRKTTINYTLLRYMSVYTPKETLQKIITKDSFDKFPRALQEYFINSTNTTKSFP